jgi:hypothetical protein
MEDKHERGGSEGACKAHRLSTVCTYKHTFRPPVDLLSSLPLTCKCATIMHACNQPVLEGENLSQACTHRLEPTGTLTLLLCRSGHAQRAHQSYTNAIFLSWDQFMLTTKATTEKAQLAAPHALQGVRRRKKGHALTRS